MIPSQIYTLDLKLHIEVPSFRLKEARSTIARTWTATKHKSRAHVFGNSPEMNEVDGVVGPLHYISALL